MMPRRFYAVDRLPLTPAGKLDRRSLGRAPATAPPIQ